MELASGAIKYVPASDVVETGAGAEGEGRYDLEDAGGLGGEDGPATEEEGSGAVASAEEGVGAGEDTGGETKGGGVQGVACGGGFRDDRGAVVGVRDRGGGGGGGEDEGE